MNFYVAKLVLPSNTTLMPLLIKSESADRARQSIKASSYFEPDSKIEIETFPASVVNYFIHGEIIEDKVYQPQNTIWT